MTPNQPSRRRLQGVVTSTKMQDTAVVRVDRRVADRKYGKYFNISKKFKVHDPGHAAHTGDLVEFEECRPMSRDKCWRLAVIVKAAPQADKLA
ncbi:30S ribosomal protein S17 [Patescibacteria group bacterium]|nr:30S ribosomal protein S17 [Patescibacteria group bacterium]MDQ5919659.1 small subunit ribosomal protein [Patescibacteria group bacterium]